MTELKHLTRNELREVARSNGFSVSGTKKELYERLGGDKPKAIKKAKPKAKPKAKKPKVDKTKLGWDLVVTPIKAILKQRKKDAPKVKAALNAEYRKNLEAKKKAEREA